MNEVEKNSLTNVNQLTFILGNFQIPGELHPLPDEQGRSLWYVAYTKGRHEKYISRQLAEREINNFVPMYHSVRRWKDRRKELDLPLFPGYVFVNVLARERIRVLQVPGVVRFVNFNGQPAPLENTEIESLKNAIVQGVKTEPHPYLKVGQKVRIKHGPLAGTTGILIRKKDKFRLVISLDLIMRSVAAEVQAADIDNY